MVHEVVRVALAAQGHFESWEWILLNPPVVYRLLKTTQNPTPGHVPWFVCAWGPELLSVFFVVASKLASSFRRASALYAQITPYNLVV